MGRWSTYRLDADTVQGNAGAWIEYKAITVGELRKYFSDPDVTDLTIIRKYVLDWNLVDDEDRPLPNPQDQPDIVDALYVHERRRIVMLLFNGEPDLEKN